MLPTASTKVQSYAGQWNVQVVRGKVTTRCLWNACRALALGMALLLLGTSMAVIGYYAEQLSEGDEMRGNATVHVRYESRGFHLNNLSYAGPIVMGVGGFIVVAACVMTFEARDSAAKVVPARFKPATAPSSARSTPRAARSSARRCERRAASSQTRTSLRDQCYRKVGEGVPRSPSAPSLVDGRNAHPSSPSDELSMLSPHLLPRQAVSMDCSHVSSHVLDMSQNYSSDSPGSMTIDLHQWRTTLSIQDESRKKRLLQRQKTTEGAEVQKSRTRGRQAPLRRCASTSTQTGAKTSRAEAPCCVHRCPVSPSRHRSFGPSDRVVPVLRRHCSVGQSPSRVVPRRPCSLGHVSLVSQQVGPSKPRRPRSTGHMFSESAPLPLKEGSGHVSPDTTPLRRLSRASCPSPNRTRSPSPSCPRGSPTRKTSLPSAERAAL